jgi:HEAT repeat protein
MSGFRAAPRIAGALAAIALSPVYLGGQHTADRTAVEERIAAHAAKGEIKQALDTYDGYVNGSKRHDAALLRPIAVAELTRLARTHPQDPVLYPGALERLARGGNAEALRDLKRAADASSSPIGIEALASLVRLDDRQAERRLGDLLGTVPANQKVTIVRAIEDAGARSQGAAVAALLQDADVSVRRVAARAVGALQYKEAIPQLKALVERDHAIVRMYAAPALKRLGDTSADAFVAQMLAGESPEMQLEAAQAYPQSSRAPWIERVKSLQGHRDPVARVRAAEVLACCDVPTARAILNDALRDPLPPMHIEAARVYELKDLADAAVARRLLGDSFDVVRLHGAGVVLRLAAKSTAKK